jgi:hypothetical protein
MRVFIIKHKGATIWHNMYFDRKVSFSDDNEINIGILFFRKKDAQAYLKTFKYSEFYEVVGANVDKSNADNRKGS